jgi:two-component system CheB/CheR fusion protein
MAKKASKRVATGRSKRQRPTRLRSQKAAAPTVTPTPAVDDPPVPIIVGVGASAGGLDAFTAMLRMVPLDANLAIVFVQHLAPQHESALVTLLTGQSALPVTQADEGMQVEPNHVYVIPPNRQLVVLGRELHISARPADRSQYTPVDAFFTSLAQSAGSRSIGIILSGTGSDGSIGIAEIKAAGGLTIAQTPPSAKYDGMPRAAIGTGMVDLVLAPEQIGPTLAKLAGEGGVAASETGITDAQMDELFELLRPIGGIDFRHYKPPTIRRRLLRRMGLHRMTAVDDYLRVLRGDASEVRNLSQDLLIHVTRFFREPESFDAIVREVFPAMLEGRLPDQAIRVWVSGCATGEEAYSLAIVLTEFLQKQASELRVQIFATDVSDAAIELARGGFYPGSIEADVSPDRLRRFFTKEGGGYRVTKMIRDLCVFARQDLTKDPPFSRLDLVLCRNVLIYMDLVLQKKLLAIFHYALRPTGFLVLGQAETVGAQATLFSLVDKKYRIHRKRPSGSPTAMTFPVEHNVAAVASKKIHAEPPSVDKVVQTEVNRIINDRFAPPGVVIDADMQIVQFRGQTGPFLEPAPGEASLNLLKMTKEGLAVRAPVGHPGRAEGARPRAKARSPGTRRQGLGARQHRGGAAGPRSAACTTWCCSSRRRGATPSAPRRPPRPSACPPAPGNPSRSSSFWSASWRPAANTPVGDPGARGGERELQSANEEVLSSNEELQSTNEELDTAKEELQSTNEELNTGERGAARPQRGVEPREQRPPQPARQRADCHRDRRRRHAHPPVHADGGEDAQPHSVGHRPIDRAHQPEPRGRQSRTADSPTASTPSPSIEREVQDREGRWFSLRVRPYRSAENKIDGAVLALFDIDAPKRYEAAVRSALGLAETLLHGKHRTVCAARFGAAAASGQRRLPRTVRDSARRVPWPSARRRGHSPTATTS